MSSTVIQPRRPAGTPVGGQWAEKQQDAPGLSLVEEDGPADEDAAPSADEADADAEDPRPRTYDIPGWRAKEAEKRIAAANRRLEKADIADRFEATYEPYTEVKQNRLTGVLERFERCRVTLNRPSIAYDGFEFAAKITTTESGKIMALSAPGQELNGWRPESLECEHCGTNRQRKNLYAVRGADGDLKVVGSSCLPAYTGITPKGLWALEWDDLEAMEKDTDDFYGDTGRSRGTPVVPGRDVLALAAAAAKVQGGYQSSYNATPTGRLVRNILWPTDRLTKEDQDLHARVVAEAKNVDTEALAAEIREALADGSDWAQNVTTLLDEEWVSDRHATLLASGISAVERMRAKKREQATIAPGFVAPVGEKITGTKAKILKLRQSTSYYGYSERTTELVRLQTEDGHIVTWWASSPIGLDEGAQVTIDRATVKKHETYNGEDQTVVTRAKLTPAD